MDKKIFNIESNGLAQDWSDEDVWEIFCEIVEREAPVSGIGSEIASSKSIFLECAAHIRWEHGFMRARYYTDGNNKPLLNPFHIEHLTRLLHHFSHCLYISKSVSEMVQDCLFYLMRGKCGINLFYKQPLTPFFLPRHALGTILGYGDWGACLYLTQGCTIGQNHRAYPSIGKGLIMGPQSMLLGDCQIGDNVILGAGAILVDDSIPDNKAVFGRPPNIVIKENSKNNIDENYFYDKISSVL